MAALCRLCLSARGDTSPIFSVSVAGVASVAVTAPGAPAPSLAARIRACVSVQVDEDDGYPTQICKKCLNNVNNWHIFKKVCDDSQAKLRDWMREDITEQQLEVKIKHEPTSEDDDNAIDASYPGIEMIEDVGRERLQPEGPPILASLGLAPRNEKSNTDPRADWDRVVAIQTLINKDEAVEGSDSSEEIDAVDISEADSDTDQDLCSFQEDDDDRSDYKSKDGYTKWHRKPSSQINANSLKRKVISGSTGDASNAQTPLQAWSCLISDGMVDNIVYHTNEYIEKRYPGVGITGDFQENLTNSSEIKALFGILYLSGIMRPAFYNSSELWWSDGCGLGIIQLAMSLDRFRFLLKCIRFDMQKSADASDNDDKLFPIRKIFNSFTDNCKNSYNIGNNVVIDDRIDAFDGPCPFRKSIKSNHHVKNGIKMYTLVEADTFYTGNIEICTEDNVVGEIARVNATVNIVKNLVGHLTGSEITVITPSKFTSLRLANTLIKEYGLSCVGGLQSKCKDIPTSFFSKNRKRATSMFGFTESGITLLSYVHPKEKASILISTKAEHYHTRKWHGSSAPEALVWYKQRRGAPRVVNSLIGAYTTSRRCNRWPLAVFFSLLDIAAINAQVIWLSNRTQSDVIFRRNFIRSLALELMNDHVKMINASEDRVSFDPDPLLAVRGGPIKNVTSDDALLRRHRRCKLCARNTDRKTKQYCLSCSTPVCKEHYKPLCTCCALKF